jgi:D-alanyl-D-alanine dipeptidase
MTVMARLRGHRITGLGLAGALACATDLGLAGALACATDPGFVDATALAPTLALDLRYASAHNFVGEPIEGYEAARCLLTEPAARALATVQSDLAATGLGLVVWDCYRPQRAVDQFVRWSRQPADPAAAARHHPNVPKGELLARGYIAARSGHSRGSTVDVGLARLADGALVGCGTPFDFFDPRSHVDADVPEPARRCRETLAAAMEERGFAPYPEEWWHFTFQPEPYPDRHFDRVIR